MSGVIATTQQWDIHLGAALAHSDITQQEVTRTYVLLSLFSQRVG